jgi:hypothetical protein
MGSGRFSCPPDGTWRGILQLQNRPFGASTFPVAYFIFPEENKAKAGIDTSRAFKCEPAEFYYNIAVYTCFRI